MKFFRVAQKIEVRAARSVDSPGQSPHQQGLPQARHALHQEVPPGKEGDKGVIHQILLADKSLAHFRSDRIQTFPGAFEEV